MTISLHPPAAAGLPTSVTWLTLPLDGALTSLGAPFATTVQYALIGPFLVFRGIIGTPGGASGGFLLATLPGTVPAPGFTRRVVVQTAATAVAGININPDRTITTGGTIADFVVLDGVCLALP
jgi:hypothetical protein